MQIDIAGGPTVQIGTITGTDFRDVSVAVIDRGPGHRGITPEQALTIAAAIELAAQQALRRAQHPGSSLRSR